MSLKQDLFDKVRAEGRVSYGAICQFTVEEGYKVSTAERRLREWMNEGKIHPEWSLSKRNTRYISAYSYQPQVRTVQEVIIENNIARVIHREVTV